LKAFNLLRNILLARTPIYVIFFVTSNCNARCKMCFNWNRTDNYRKEDELTLEEIKKIFRTFSMIQQLTISGGEPFLREDLPEILEYISRKNKVQQITIPSNGIKSQVIFYQAHEILKRIDHETQLRIGMSIQGIDGLHDEIVQVKGAFKNIESTYKKLQILQSHYNNLQLGVSICLNQYNKQQFHAILNEVSRRFPDCDVSITLVRGKPRDEASLNVTTKEFNDAIFHFKKMQVKARTESILSRIYYALITLVYRQIPLVRKNKNMPTRCFAQSKLIVLQSNGDVYPCEYLDKTLGNIRAYQYSIQAMLHDKKDVLDFIKKRNCYCTWECALSNNIVHSPKLYSAVLREMLRNIIEH